MIKLKNILAEQGSVKTFVIQTPAPKAALDIVRSTKPRGAAFILKSTDVLGEEPSIDTILNLLKLDNQFGENSVWARSLPGTDDDEFANSFVYLIGPDLKDAQRKTKFIVMIVPANYIVSEVLGPDETDSAKKRIIYESLITDHRIGDASVMMQSEFDALKTKIAPLLDKAQNAALKAELEKTKQALAAVTEPPIQQQTPVGDNDVTDKNPETITNKAQDLLTRLETAPIKLNTKSDDVAYIQDLIYRIGMKTPELGNNNDYPEWVAFRDAKPQYGTYGTRTYNFLSFLGFTAATTATDSITADVFRQILDAGKPLGITESKIKLKNLIFEQFVIKQKSDQSPVQKELPANTKKDLGSNTNTKKSDTKKSDTKKSDTKKTDTTSTITFLDKSDSDLITKIWQDVYDVVTKNPDKYFSKFSSWYNDDEEKAASWLINAFNKAWSPSLKKLRKSKSWYIQKNCDNILYVVNYISNKLIRDGYTGTVSTTFYYLDKNSKWAKQLIKFRWDYM